MKLFLYVATLIISSAGVRADSSAETYLRPPTARLSADTNTNYKSLHFTASRGQAKLQQQKQEKAEESPWWKYSDECSDLLKNLAEMIASAHSDKQRFPLEEGIKLAWDFITMSGTYNQTYWENWDALDNSTFVYELIQADHGLSKFLGVPTEMTYWEFDLEGGYQSIIPFEMFVAASRIGKFSDNSQQWETVSINTIPSFGVQLKEKCGCGTCDSFWENTVPFSLGMYQKHIAMHYDQKRKTWDEPIPAFLNVDVLKDGEELPRGNGTWPLQNTDFYLGEMAMVPLLSKKYGVSPPPFHIYSRKPNCKEILDAFATDYPKLKVTCDECPGQNWINCVA